MLSSKSSGSNFLLLLTSGSLICCKKYKCIYGCNDNNAGMEVRHADGSVRDGFDHPSCHLLQHPQESRVAQGSTR